MDNPLGLTTYLTRLKFLPLVFIVIVLAGTAFAETRVIKKKKRVRRDTGQNAVVAVEGAAVYKFANFDAPILDYLEKAKKVKISKKLYEGIGGLGAFYKIRVAKKKYGYIADVDVIAGAQAQQAQSQDKPKDKGPTGDPGFFSGGDPSEEGGDGETIYFSRYIGGVFGSMGFSETVFKKQYSDSLSVFGVKLSGPRTLYGELPLDFELLIHMGVPSYYKKLGVTSSDPTGLLLMGHVIFAIPLLETSRVIVYTGLGMSYVYSKFDIPVSGYPAIDSQEIRLGLATQLGVGFSLTKTMMLKLEGKYYYEVESYGGATAALQFRY